MDTPPKAKANTSGSSKKSLPKCEPGTKGPKCKANKGSLVCQIFCIFTYYLSIIIVCADCGASKAVGCSRCAKSGFCTNEGGAPSHRDEVKAPVDDDAKFQDAKTDDDAKFQDARSH